MKYRIIKSKHNKYFTVIDEKGYQIRWKDTLSIYGQHFTLQTPSFESALEYCIKFYDSLESSMINYDKEYDVISVFETIEELQEQYPEYFI